MQYMIAIGCEQNLTEAEARDWLVRLAPGALLNFEEVRGDEGRHRLAPNVGLACVEPPPPAPPPAEPEPVLCLRAALARKWGEVMAAAEARRLAAGDSQQVSVAAVEGQDEIGLVVCGEGHRAVVATFDLVALDGLLAALHRVAADVRADPHAGDFKARVEELRRLSAGGAKI